MDGGWASRSLSLEVICQPSRGGGDLSFHLERRVAWPNRSRSPLSPGWNLVNQLYNEERERERESGGERRTRFIPRGGRKAWISVKIPSFSRISKRVAELGIALRSGLARHSLRTVPFQIWPKDPVALNFRNCASHESLSSETFHFYKMDKRVQWRSPATSCLQMIHVSPRSLLVFARVINA